ncbi:DUF4175 family protein [Mucilaginibacter litoreus]|uniref:DUF4175 family protein n=1 Tax=Mucilaginibacter litoreus TaxID=1048221 RepID=A0ABW3AR00_9SPHI
MAERTAIHIINKLRRRWIVYHVLEDVLFSAYAGLYIGALGYYLVSHTMLWGIVAFVLVLGALLFIHRPWAIGDDRIVAFLNKQYPELEESTHLILLPAAERNVLESLAGAKAEEVLGGLKVSHKPFAKGFVVAFVSLLIVTGFIWALGRIFHVDRIFYGPDRPVATCAPEKPEVVLPQISSVEITITQPAYISTQKLKWNKFNITVAENAILSWRIKTNVAVKNMSLVFDDKELLKLSNQNNGTVWQASKKIVKPGFYQVKLDGKLSDLYQIQVIKDAPPVIHVKSPKAYTYIDAGEAQKVNVTASVDDDYGVTNAQLIATVAKGRGEGVKFTEYKIPFGASFAQHTTKYNLQKLIDLPSLKMEPGDELYFYVQAQDTYHQLSRTDVYTVSIQDTAELLSMNGMLTGSTLKPEFFRSERQIIIDAEKLLKDKDSISVEKFNARSNDLVIDQKLLRLRYGKFLGEESEDAIGAPDNDPADPADFSNAQKILKEYTDDHDNAEDAGFFEPAIKAQLKATLTEMWKAELQLRLYKPQAALPFAYKALRLLKDLQQKSRSYVAKTAYNPPPLKLEKRLSGELDKVVQPLNQEEIKPGTDKYESLKRAVAVLQALQPGKAVPATDRIILQKANQQMSQHASAQPGTYLPALNAMRRLLSMQSINANDVALVEKALQRTLTPLKTLPAAGAQQADMGLSKQYYKNLKPINR